MKRDGAGSYKHMRRDTPFPFRQLYAFWITLPFSHKFRTYLIDGPLLTMKYIKTFEYRIH